MLAREMRKELKSHGFEMSEEEEARRPRRRNRRRLRRTKSDLPEILKVTTDNTTKMMYGDGGEENSCFG